MVLHETHCPQTNLSPRKEKKKRGQKRISSAKTKHCNNRIIDSSSANEHHSTMNELLGTAKSPILPTSYNTAELLSMFSSSFSANIKNILD